MSIIALGRVQRKSHPFGRVAFFVDKKAKLEHTKRVILSGMWIEIINYMEEERAALMGGPFFFCE